MKRKAFTLVELLIVISILTILISLLIPSMGQVFYNTHLVKCRKNLKDIHSGVAIYADDNYDLFPRYGDFRNGPNEFGYRSITSGTLEDQRKISGSIIHQLRPYYDNMKVTFMCDALAENSLWDTLGLDLDYDNNDELRHRELPAGYMLNFNATARYKLNHTYSQAETNYGIHQDNEWANPDNIMQRMGDTFKFRANWTSDMVSFDIIASDYMFYEGAYGAHVPPNIAKTEAVRGGHHSNYAFFIAPYIDNNLIFSDGSIKNYESIMGSRIRNVSFHLQWADSSPERIPYFPAKYNLYKD